MQKDDFKENTRYTITLRGQDGKLRPANIYVYKQFAAAMIARMTDKSGFLHKIAYDDVTKIVKTLPVDAQHQFAIPAPVLDEKTWKDRNVMERYSSASNMGK